MSDLETMRPTPTWDPDAHADAVEALAAAEPLTVHVWGADWCADCRSQLPDFAAALDAAGVTDVREHVVDRDKSGPGVDDYGIEYIPTVVVERGGRETARFVESEPVSITEYLADRIAEASA
jgi:thioredoxin-like negative regulator of GroEL